MCSSSGAVYGVRSDLYYSTVGIKSKTTNATRETNNKGTANKEDNNNTDNKELTTTTDNSRTSEARKTKTEERSKALGNGNAATNGKDKDGNKKERQNRNSFADYSRGRSFSYPKNRPNRKGNNSLLSPKSGTNK